MPPLISVVDDDDSVRLALAALLDAYGYRVDSYPSAEAFLENARFDDIACLITDIQMPGISGIDLKARMTLECPEVPVIMVTARVEKVLLDRIAASAPFRMLPKPVDAERLILAVEDALSL